MNHRRVQNIAERKTVRRKPAVVDVDHASVPDRPVDILAAARAATEQAQRLRDQSAALGEVHAALREANQRFAEMHDFVPIPYLIVSGLGVIQQVNESALQLLGGDREWIVGRPFIAYVDTPDMRKALTAVLGSWKNQSQSVEIRLRAPDGPRPVQIVSRRYGTYGSEAVFHIAIVDLSEIRRLDEERRIAEEGRRKSQESERIARAASEAKDEFLAMLSHELRTPLTPILAAVDSLASHHGIAGEAGSKIDIIRRNVKAEARLIDDLLDLPRITRNKLDVQRKPTDLHAVVDEIVDAWRAPLRERHIGIDVDLGADAHWVNGDAGRIGQVIRNVLSNAAKFSEEGARIRVRTEDYDGRVRVTVSDTGIGMTENQIQNLFRPFVQSEHWSSRRGLGLGLVISHAIVEAHQGTLEVWSGGPGEGTTVRVELPTIPAPAVNPAAPADGLRNEPAMARVLLVEDDPDSADMLAMLLTYEGFEVRVAPSVREARVLADRCEVIVSDIALPDGSGLDLMRAIREHKRMRGIALSGYGAPRDVQKSLEAGFEEHLTKPVDLERLVAAVRRLTRE